MKPRFRAAGGAAASSRRPPAESWGEAIAGQRLLPQTLPQLYFVGLTQSSGILGPSGARRGSPGASPSQGRACSHSLALQLYFEVRRQGGKAPTTNTIAVL